METTQLEPEVVNLAKAIRQIESQGNFQSRGASGEYGAYQFMPDTWKGWSVKYLGKEIPLEKATKEQQNEVAYKQIKEWKDAGHNVGEIASLWNSGNAQKYKQGWKGEAVLPSGRKIKYDTPAYAERVALAYQNLKKQAQILPESVQAPETLLGQLGGRLTQAVGYGPGTEPTQPTGLKSIVSGFQGDTTPGVLDNAARIAMGVSDIAGAAGGAIGDIVGAGIGWLDKKVFGDNISKTTQKIFEIPEVKEGVIKYQDWAKQNPEISRQVGNAFNIFTSLIPAAKTVSAVKNLASGGIAAEFNSTYAGRKLLQNATKQGIDPIKVMNQAAYEMPDSWWKKMMSVGPSEKTFHASLLKEPIDDMISRQSRVIQKLYKVSDIKVPGVASKISAAKTQIKGLQAVKEMIDEISKVTPKRTFKNKIPIVGRFTTQPQQGLISRALLEKGSKAAKTAAKKTLVKTLPVLGGTSALVSNRVKK